MLATRRRVVNQRLVHELHNPSLVGHSMIRPQIATQILRATHIYGRRRTVAAIMLILQSNSRSFFLHSFSDEVKRQAADGIGQITSKQGKPPLRHVAKVRLKLRLRLLCELYSVTHHTDSRGKVKIYFDGLRRRYSRFWHTI